MRACTRVRACVHLCVSLLPQGARLDHGARPRRICSLLRHTHRSARLHPGEADRRCCSASAAGDPGAEGGETHTHARQRTRANTHTHASFRRNLVHGEICGDGVATQAGMEAFLRRVQSRLGVSSEPSEYHDRSRMRVFMNETRTLCYRLRSCC